MTTSSSTSLGAPAPSAEPAPARAKRRRRWLLEVLGAGLPAEGRVDDAVDFWAEHSGQ